MTQRKEELLNDIVIKFAGDSGDGMQLTGSQFTNNTALLGIDLATFPDFPAEIRAPQGTIPGVSGYQLRFSSDAIYTPGDLCDVLVAMNAAALKTNLKAIKKGGKIIANVDGFDSRNLRLANYPEGVNPLDDNSLDGFELIKMDVTKMTREALKEITLGTKEKDRAKNMFVLGFLYWMYNRDMESTLSFLKEKFGKKDDILNANLKALQAGYNFGDTTETFTTRYTVEKAKMKPGTYRSIMGNQALSMGLVAAAQKSGLPLFLGSYPITPASDILHDLSKLKNFNVKTFQAEDEIAGITSAIGAAYGGSLAVTTTSGPGLALKGEAIGLAVMLEIPLLIIDVQRGGPSTGLPTKTEQSDLLQAMYGRNGESPVIVIAASTPADCFNYAYEAARLALEHMTPVILLTDGYIANGSAPWKIRSVADMPEIKNRKVTKVTENWSPYHRDPKTLARDWAVPGTPGLEHRVGGLEKDSVTGNVSHVPENHELMTKTRAEKIKLVQNNIPELEVEYAQEGDLLVVGWGGTYGTLHSAVKQINAEGYKNIGFVHFNYINPMPKNTEAIFSKFKKIIVCELNAGQFSFILKANFSNFDFQQINKVQGLPFSNDELIQKFKQIL